MPTHIGTYYSLIQIQKRDERANVGVVLFCPSQKILLTRVHVNLNRLNNFFGEQMDWAVEHISAVAYRLNHGTFSTRTQLDDWINKRGNDIVLTPLRFIKFSCSFEEELEKLLVECVSN